MSWKAAQRCPFPTGRTVTHVLLLKMALKWLNIHHIFQTHLLVTEYFKNFSLWVFKHVWVEKDFFRIMMWTVQWLRSAKVEKSFFQEYLGMSEHQWEKCTGLNGDHVERFWWNIFKIVIVIKFVVEKINHLSYILSNYSFEINCIYFSTYQGSALLSRNEQLINGCIGERSEVAWEDQFI